VKGRLSLKIRTLSSEPLIWQTIENGKPVVLPRGLVEEITRTKQIVGNGAEVSTELSKQVKKFASKAPDRLWRGNKAFSSHQSKCVAVYHYNILFPYRK
jgi:hypothetical protein